MLGKPEDAATVPPTDELDVRLSEGEGPPANPEARADRGPPQPRQVGPFRVVSKLGEGGMGVVYRAIDDRLRRPVALKLLPQELASDPRRKLRLLREARSAAALVHPNITTVFEVGEADGRVYLAMELVEGSTLRACLAGGRLPVAEARRVATEIARGLAKAHKIGIVHRDLKPDNVMLTTDGAVKILDFGLAKRVDDLAAPEDASVLTAAGGILGTPGYMSPEQARGQPVDARTDVFAFGAMLYEMLAGERPFRGKSFAELIADVLTSTPQPLRERDPELDAELVDLVERCLAKDASERPLDGQALVEALAGAGAGDDGATRPSTPRASRPDRESGSGFDPPLLATSGGALTRTTSRSGSDAGVAPPTRARRIVVGLALMAGLGGALLARSMTTSLATTSRRCAPGRRRTRRSWARPRARCRRVRARPACPRSRRRSTRRRRARWR